jgi:internalin A
MSASDVSLDYHCCCSQQVTHLQHFEQLCEVLCQNSSLTSLEVTFGGRPRESLSFRGILEALTNLQSLSFGTTVHVAECNYVPVPECIVALKGLTCLRLYQGFSLTDLPLIVPRLTRLRKLQLLSVPRHQHLLCLSFLIGLQALELLDCNQLSFLPPLDALTALQTLVIRRCGQVQLLPALTALTNLSILDLCGCAQLEQLPQLHTLTALKTLDLTDCSRIQQLPHLDSLTALQTVSLTR